MESKMTFEEFQATRSSSEDLAADVPSENSETIGTPKGNLYMGRLYIDHVELHWPENARKRGQWHLILEAR
jgi:hypothetical protein